MWYAPPYHEAREAPVWDAGCSGRPCPTDTSLEAQSLSPPLPGYSTAQVSRRLHLPCAHSRPEAFSSLKLFLSLGREKHWHSGRREKLKVEKPRTAGCILPSLLSLIPGYVAGGNRTMLQAHWHEAQTLHLSEHDALMIDWLSLWEVSWTQNHLLILIFCLIHAQIYSTYGKRDPQTLSPFVGVEVLNTGSSMKAWDFFQFSVHLLFQENLQ